MPPVFEFPQIKLIGLSHPPTWVNLAPRAISWYHWRFPAWCSHNNLKLPKTFPPPFAGTTRNLMASPVLTAAPSPTRITKQKNATKIDPTKTNSNTNRELFFRSVHDKRERERSIHLAFSVNAVYWSTINQFSVSRTSRLDSTLLRAVAIYGTLLTSQYTYSGNIRWWAKAPQAGSEVLNSITSVRCRWLPSRLPVRYATPAMNVVILQKLRLYRQFHANTFLLVLFVMCRMCRQTDLRF